MGRTISPSFASVIEQLELDGDRIVSVDRLAEVLREVGLGGDPRQLAYDLQRAEWLGSLRTRGAWEFLPAARGGAYSSGDRFIEFRAQIVVNRTWPGLLAMESAASILGLAQRIPEREVLALPPGVAPPKAFAGEWRIISLRLPEMAMTSIDGLPTWNLEGLLAGIAARPSGYRDAPGLGQWLSEGVSRIDVEMLLPILERLSMAALQRAAYLLRVGGNQRASDEVLREHPPSGVAWFGPRGPGGSYDAETRVNDTVLHRFLTVGAGA